MVQVRCPNCGTMVEMGGKPKQVCKVCNYSVHGPLK
jgi:hypothetical protein